MTLLVANPENRAPTQKHLGHFVTPRSYPMPKSPMYWAADNDAFSGFDPSRYLRMLDRITKCPFPPAWITVPDVVGDHQRTLELWYQWKPELLSRNLPPAFVIQNGIETYEHYWDSQWADQILPDDASAYFIGGTTEFKFSNVVRRIAETSSCDEKYIHMGRVNSVKRMKYAESIGCSSCDGSGMARFSRTVLQPMLDALTADLKFRQLTLF